MSLVRWEPYQEFNNFRDSVNRMWDNNFGMISPGSQQNGIFPVDMKDTPEAILLQAEIPGMKKEDICLSYRDNILTIKAERKCEEKCEKENNYLRSERRHGMFTRSFSMGTPIDGDKITASYKDGILHVNMPKQEKAKEKKIDISING